MGRWKTSGDGWECRPDGHWIETERLIVRPMTRFDAEALFGVLDAEVVRWQGYPTDRTELRKMAGSWAVHANEPRPDGRPHYQWVVCDRGSGEVVGMRSMLMYTGRQRGHAYETGGSFKADYRGRGYATEELRALLAMVGAHLGFGVAYAGTSPDNLKALRLYQGCGFQRVNTRPDWVLPNGTSVDAVVLRHQQRADRTCRTALRPRWF